MEPVGDCSTEGWVILKEGDSEGYVMMVDHCHLWKIQMPDPVQPPIDVEHNSDATC